MTDHGKSDVSKLVRVAQLEWEDEYNDEVEAKGPLAKYNIARVLGGSWWVTIGGYFVAEGADLDAVKAAAQADFERRILACITTRTGAAP